VVQAGRPGFGINSHPDSSMSVQSLQPLASPSVSSVEFSATIIAAGFRSLSAAGVLGQEMMSRLLGTRIRDSYIIAGDITYI
jgi:hypothetical protein